MVIICLHKEVNGEELNPKKIDELINIFSKMLIRNLNITDNYKITHIKNRFLTEYDNKKNEIIIIFEKPPEIDGKNILNIIIRFIDQKFIKEIRELNEIKKAA